MVGQAIGVWVGVRSGGRCLFAPGKSMPVVCFSCKREEENWTRKKEEGAGEKKKETKLRKHCR